MSANSHIKAKIQGDIPVDISVVMPLFNKEKEVSSAVQSVLNQTVREFELIVVNDGSTDKGPHLVREMNHQRIRLIEQENRGVSAARNRGIQEARGEIIAFLDADDEWMPDFLETILNLKTRFHYCQVFATNYLYRETSGHYRYPIIRGLPDNQWQGVLTNYFAIAAYSDPPIWSSAVAVSKNALSHIGLFPVGVQAGEDLLTWARLALGFRIAYCSVPKAIFKLRAPLAGKPTRSPDSEDRVGKCLENLLNKVPKAWLKDFEEYIALWHRMRAACFLELGIRSQAKQEVAKMAKFSERRLLLSVYAIAAYAPLPFSVAIINILDQLKAFRRSSISLSGIESIISS
jgi:glycosyltransferase involved in cell wall biosynthesis